MTSSLLKPTKSSSSLPVLSRHIRAAKIKLRDVSWSAGPQLPSRKLPCFRALQGWLHLDWHRGHRHQVHVLTPDGIHEKMKPSLPIKVSDCKCRMRKSAGVTSGCCENCCGQVYLMDFFNSVHSISHLTSWRVFRTTAWM